MIWKENCPINSASYKEANLMEVNESTTVDTSKYSVQRQGYVDKANEYVYSDCIWHCTVDRKLFLMLFVINVWIP